MFITEPAHPFKNPPFWGSFCVYCVILLTLLPKKQLITLIHIETQYLNNKSFTLTFNTLKTILN